MLKKEQLAGITKVIIPDDFDGLVDALNWADGMMDRVVLSCDKNLCLIMEHLDLANCNARGSYGGGKKLKKLYGKDCDWQAVEKVIINYCKRHKIKVLKRRIEYHYDEV